MLKTQVPAYLCSTAFSLALFSPADRRQPLVLGMGKTIYHTSSKSAKTLHKKSGLSMIAPPDKKDLKFVRSYIRENDHCLLEVKQRSEVPFTIIDSVFNQYGLPHELKYLAVIESELKSSAVSRVGAKGPWQLMPATAKILGLKVTRGSDDRMNYYKSTKAAARYLKDLYHQFGDWLLVLAAYNGGPGPVFHAIHKSHNRNFWAIQKWLPAESRQHVKKFIATDYYFRQTAARDHLASAQPATQPLAALPPASLPIRENQDDKFSRLMNESAQSLQKSHELLARSN
jgi:hypothetical protein